IQGVPAAFAVMTVVLVLLAPAPARLRVPAAALLGLAAVVPWQLVRLEGVFGAFDLNPVWRWSETAEETVARFTQEEALTAPPAGVDARGGGPALRRPGRPGAPRDPDGPRREGVRAGGDRRPRLPGR